MTVVVGFMSAGNKDVIYYACPKGTQRAWLAIYYLVLKKFNRRGKSSNFEGELWQNY